MTDGQLASLSWCQAPVWALWRHFYCCHTVARLLILGAVSDERMGLPFTIAAGPRQHNHSWSRVLQDSWPYFTVSDSRPPTWRVRSPYLYPPGTWWPSYTPRHWVTFLSPLQPTRQGYGEGIRTHLHAGIWTNFLIHFSYKHSAQTPWKTQSLLLTMSLHCIAQSNVWEYVYWAVA
jgi:hypothetical protein